MRPLLQFINDCNSQLYDHTNPLTHGSTRTDYRAKDFLLKVAEGQQKRKKIWSEPKNAPH
jgi:hypothetical protein